jgi:sodium-dependent dicarboxylate transporter 2/3/5
MIKKVGFFLGPLLFFMSFFMPLSVAMGKLEWAFLGAFFWIVTWWVTEAMPIAVASLLPLVLFPMSGLMELKQVSQCYGEPIIFLFLGGFCLAIAIEKWHLHQHFSLRLLLAFGQSKRRVLIGFALATTFISIWISNTATTLMMMTIALPVINIVETECGDSERDRKFGKALMLIIAFCSTIGGMMSLVGTPPNILFAGFMKQQYGIEISMFDWFKVGIPVGLILLVFCLMWILWGQYRFDHHEMSNLKPKIKLMIDELGPFNTQSKLILGIFGLVCFLWMFNPFIERFSGIPLTDSSIAMLGALLLFCIPASTRSTERLLGWKDAESKIPWGILMLFGGGVSLSAGFQHTRLGPLLSDCLMHYSASMSDIVLIIILTLSMILLSEVATNSAALSLFFPILIIAADIFSISPMVIGMPVALACSGAFMMPAGTPANALVFGWDGLEVKDMIKAGFVLDIISALTIVGISYAILL